MKKWVFFLPEEQPLQTQCFEAQLIQQKVSSNLPLNGVALQLQHSLSPKALSKQ